MEGNKLKGTGTLFSLFQRGQSISTLNEKQPERLPDGLDQLERAIRDGYLTVRIDDARSRVRRYQGVERPDLLTLMQGAEKRLANVWAPQTLRNYTNSTAAFLEFRSGLPTQMSTELAAVLWAETELARGVRPQGVIQYLKDLSAACTHMGTPLLHLKHYKSALKREGALRPIEQAAPIPKEVAYELIQTAINAHEDHIAVHLMVMWFTASRFDDVQKLQPTRLRPERALNDAKHQWNVDYCRSKSNQFYLGGSSKMILPLPLHHYLRDFLSRRALRTTLTECTYNDVDRFLKEKAPDYTCHSFKRGALQAMLQGGVQLPLLQAIAKHRSLETLLIYLDSSMVSEAMGMSNAASLL